MNTFVARSHSERAAESRDGRTQGADRPRVGLETALLRCLISAN